MAAGLLHSPLPAGSGGYRSLCHVEVLLYGTLGASAGLWALRRLAPLRRVQLGVLVGVVSGAIPAYLMQLGCMYEPTHNLLWHFSPVLAVALIGGCLAKLVLRKI